MDIYGNSDCKVEPEKPEEAFDAEKFTTAFYNADTDLTTDSFIDLEHTSLLVQAAYDQGRADEAAKAKKGAP